MRRLFVITMLVALCATGASATVWDAVDGFFAGNVAANGTGIWSYGYGVGPAVDSGIGWTGFGGYFDYTWGDDIVGGGWTRSAQDYSPYLMGNKTDEYNAGSCPPHSLCFSSGLGGDDYMVFVRWKAPADGYYQVDGVFEMMTAAAGGYWGGEMDGYVVVDGAIEFSTYVSGGWYGYDPGPKSFTDTYYLTAGSIVDFVGGIGSINELADFINIKGSKVTAVPEPSSILALLGGLAGVAGYIRRRK